MSIVFILFASNVAQAAQRAVVHPTLIEVFTTANLPITGEAAINQQSDFRESELHVYELDGIQRMEAELSRGLSGDLVQSKRIVLQRIQQLDEVARARMQRTAMGLAKVVQYGVDRYPAIMFEGEVVIYGVTDIREALHQYQQWREGGRR